MAEAILWPDVEAAVIAYLKPRIAAAPLPFAADVRVATKLTDKDGDARPQWAVIVRNDGGSKFETVFADVSVALNIWGADPINTPMLAGYVGALMNSIAESGVTPFTRASAGVAYPIPEESGQPHLYLTASLAVRGVNL